MERKKMTLGLFTGSIDKLTAAGVIISGAVADDYQVDVYVLLQGARVFKKEVGDDATQLPMAENPQLKEEFEASLKELKVKTWLEFFRTAKELSLDEFTRRIDKALCTRSSAISFNRKVRNVGVVSGGGWFAINEAEKYNIDTFLTGEPSHSAYTLAEEMKVNLIFAGHYATETLGVRAVGQMLQKRFGIPVEFIDHPTGL